MKSRKSPRQKEAEAIAAAVGVALLLLIFAGCVAITSFNNKRQREEEIARKEERVRAGEGGSYSYQLEDYDRNQISSLILAVSCAGKEKVIQRGMIGGNLKKLLTDRGYNPADVLQNWSYYWSRAKEMDEKNKTYCLR